MTLGNTGLCDLIWNIQSSPDWVIPDSVFGFIYASDSSDLNLTVTAENLEVGQYSDTLLIDSNDPLNPDKYIVLNLNVILTGAIDGENNLPDRFALRQNYPNPFNPVTTIKYDLPADALVQLNIYDMLGRKVITLLNERKPAGYHSIVWDGKNSQGELVNSGVYFYQLSVIAGDGKQFQAVKKLILLK